MKQKSKRRGSEIENISPNSRTRRIVMVAFPDAQIIDITCPLEVFGRAARLLTEERGWHVPAYTVEIAATKAGALTTSSGIRVIADRSIAQVRGPIDTILVAGGRGTTTALRDRAMIEWLRGSMRRTRRICSVCTGAFLARGGWAARWIVGDDALAAMRSARGELSGGVGRDRSDLCARRQNIHLGRCDCGNRSGAGSARGRPRPRRCSCGGARTRHVPAASRRAIAVFCSTQHAAGGSRADPRLAAMGSRSPRRRPLG